MDSKLTTVPTISNNSVLSLSNHTHTHTHTDMLMDKPRTEELTTLQQPTREQDLQYSWTQDPNDNGETFLDEDKFVNLGYSNWQALRQAWKRRPETWVPPKKKQTNDEIVFKELMSHGMLSKHVPLTDFIRIMNEIWESEGVS